MSTQTTKNSSRKNDKKTGLDSEVTRVVLIFMLLLVIIVLLVAAFISLGGGETPGSSDSRIVIQVPDGDGTLSAETTSPNHGNTETDPIPAEVLNPDLANETSPPQTEEVIATAPETEPPVTAITTTGTRPANTSPVYIVTDETGDSTEIATLAPPRTTAYDESAAFTSNPTTITTTIPDSVPEPATPPAGDGTITNTNYTISLSGSASIYSSPGGSANGTIGSNGTFTIVQEMTDANGVKWGKLKSGAGWVRLN